ncbi:MAG: hypothetical protein AB8I08_01785 [Sandaracinaceae bacterium]
MDEADARAVILNTNSHMRVNYKGLKDRVQTRLDPLVVVANGPEGGTYWLIQNGSVIEMTTPIDVIFQLAKSVAHIPLGTFSILAPYLPKSLPDHHRTAGDIDPHDLSMVAFERPSSTAWVQPLKEWGDQIRLTEESLEHAALPAELLRSSANICDAAGKFIEKTIESGSFTMSTFEGFTGALFDDISTNMHWAAKYQIEAVTELMGRWKTRLGSKWRDLYVLVYSMWTTSVLNQNTIIIRHFLDADRVDTHLIDIIADQLPVDDPVGVATENLARIVQDNIASEMVFPTSQTTADALEGKEDLLSQQILDILGDRVAAEIAAASCPFDHKRERRRASKE